MVSSSTRVELKLKSSICWVFFFDLFQEDRRVATRVMTTCSSLFVAVESCCLTSQYQGSE